MRVGYLDCFSGVSGDMLLGALLDCGLPESVIRQVVDDLGLSGVEITISRRRHGALTGVHVQITCATPQPLRHLDRITGLLANSRLQPAIRDRAVAVFTRLAEAEARVHGQTIEDVHFHEVGAVDTLVDIVATITGLDHLGVDRLLCSPLPITNGWTICEHGAIPLPAPAVSTLLQGVPVYGVSLTQELVTPTGAALVRELVDDFGPLPPMTVDRCGFGAGTLEREDNRPNLLRLWLGRSLEVEEAQAVEVIETQMDDWSPEAWPHVSSLLMEAGALDLSLTPLLMKKGRPGFRLQVICRPETAPVLKEIIFQETTAIGLRCHRQDRTTLERWPVELNTPWGPVTAKAVRTPAGTRVTPEYEECRRIAREHGIALATVHEMVRALAGTAANTNGEG